LREALPFVVNVFPRASTAAERDAGWRELDLLLPAQREHNAELAECLRVLRYDIHRLEKLHPAFQSPESLGNVWSERLLQAYCMYRPESPYHQGMLDFVHPILLAFFQDWDGRAPEGSAAALVKVFWCFGASTFFSEIPIPTRSRIWKRSSTRRKRLCVGFGKW
jgi:hypothetical protein